MELSVEGLANIGLGKGKDLLRRNRALVKQQAANAKIVPRIATMLRRIRKSLQKKQQPRARARSVMSRGSVAFKAASDALDGLEAFEEKRGWDPLNRRDCVLDVARTARDLVFERAKEVVDPTVADFLAILQPKAEPDAPVPWRESCGKQDSRYVHKTRIVVFALYTLMIITQMGLSVDEFVIDVSRDDWMNTYLHSALTRPVEGLNVSKNLISTMVSRFLLEQSEYEISEAEEIKTPSRDMLKAVLCAFPEAIKEVYPKKADA